VPAQKVSEQGNESEFTAGIDAINRLVGKVPPLMDDDDEDLEAAIETSKKLHAALSKQQNVVVGLSAEELTGLRHSIVGNVDVMIDALSR
jgi:hypothetical protein